MVNVETVLQLHGFTAAHLDMLQRAEKSLKSQEVFKVGDLSWIIVGITMNERRQEIQIRGVRVIEDAKQIEHEP